MRRGLTLLPLALAATGVTEIAVFVLVGRRVGFGVAVLLVLLASLVGVALLRREGVRAWRGFRDAARAGRPPGEQVTDGLVGLGAGLLLAVPGLVTGLVGALLILPPVRRQARRRVQRAAERRISSAVAGDLFGPRRVRVYRGAAQSPRPPQHPSPRTASGAGTAIEGEIV
ncbi:UPF0716 protein FxsA [Micromonospora pattaloongensis]|uniref:UPF0716 protein FxsA n=1 Tax=Micromonospora pattaloongensis TaxID=405436 RepID=A0A1H3P6A1_9ACTN|nr:FxsA family protein [Micromonospora pattaloongensis]SDY96642.1 UPF0716 protein FxsA [Micromonospora pattaloongensis]